MDLKKLEYFESIYRLRNFTKAAKEQYISQPSISAAMQKLEEELGVRLINREDKPLSFTPEGEAFIQSVYTILNNVTNAKNEMKYFSKPHPEDVRIAWASIYNDFVLLKFYEDFRNKYPNYIPFISENTTSGMLSQLLNEEIEIAYALIPEDIDYDSFEVIPLQCCELCAVISKQNPLSENSKVSIYSLSNETLLLPPKGALVRAKLDTYLKKIDGVREDFPEVNQMRIMFKMAENNHGIAFTAMGDVDPNTMERLNVVLSPLKENIVITKGILLKKGRPHSAGTIAAVDFIKESIQEFRQKLRD